MSREGGYMGRKVSRKGDYLVPYSSMTKDLMRYAEEEFDDSGIESLDDCKRFGVDDCSGLTWHYVIEVGDRIVFPVDWRTNDPFRSMMHLQELTSGSSGWSSKYVWWIDGSGVRYPMFISDFVELCKRGSVNHGVSVETWYVRKRGGQYYGLARYN